LRGVAWGPSVETGAGVPGYSGGLAAAWGFLSRIRVRRFLLKRLIRLWMIGARRIWCG
jgi:hypothetical protein